MNYVILFLIAGVIVYAIAQKVDVYGAFVAGAKEGVQTTARIFPYMVALMVGITIFRTSGAIDLLGKLFAPLFRVFQIPIEMLPLAMLKPFSGGASIGVLADLFRVYGVDSQVGRIASVMMGSSETIFYTIALYFGSVGIKNMRYTVACAFIAHFAGILAAVFVVRLFF